MKNLQNEAKHLKIGRLGEQLAAKFLVKHGFTVAETNYRKFYGEIDIIAQKEGMYHFIEVKSVSRENVTRETSDFRPEDNVHYSKRVRLSKTIETYLAERGIERDFAFHIVTVRIDEKTKTARIELIDEAL